MRYFHSVVLLLLGSLGFSSCQKATPPQKAPFVWANANVYFMMIDRFNNGDPSNDAAFDRKKDGAALRNFEGGDIRGIIQKLEAGYFDEVGISALWITPPVEQIRGAVDEGFGNMYGFHGYWARDWSAIDPAFGTRAELKELVDKAHARGIRILLDVVINQTGPVTEFDSQWPGDWVRTEPRCTYQDWKSTIECTLVSNLPDVKTESNEAVELPQFLLDKWKAEGRLEEELRELDTFFAETGHPRAPRFYIMKWLADYVREMGIDGYRVDTVKHVEATVWGELFAVASAAFEAWKKEHPDKVLDNTPFFMVGEAWGFNADEPRDFRINGHEAGIDYYTQGFSSMINFSFKYHTTEPAPVLFSNYANRLADPKMAGFTMMNYISSHDDDQAADRDRLRPIETGTKLLLSPGMSQVYYGDETARRLWGDATVQGDAHLRTFMNWSALSDTAKQHGFAAADVLAHWQKLGRFRRNNPAVGAGTHTELQKSPYVFSRSYSAGTYTNDVLVALDLPKEPQKRIPVFETFKNGEKLTDYYSGKSVIVKDGTVVLETPFDIVLLGRK